MSQSTELMAPVPTSPSGIATLDPAAREVGVTLYLSDARDRLALALAESGPEAVASIRAEMATVQEMTKQLGLSRDIQDDAAEMVRRSEYALGKAIKAGQEAGVVRVQREDAGRPSTKIDSVTEPIKPSPTDFAANSTLYGDGKGSPGILSMAEATEDQFEDALTEARQEGNVSRANVARKICESREPRKRETGERGELWGHVRTLAAEGYSVYEAYERVDYGSGPDAFAATARRKGISFTSHKARVRAIAEHVEWFERGILSIEAGIDSLTDLVDLKNISHDNKTEALERLTDAQKTLASFIRTIKKEINK